MKTVLKLTSAILVLAAYFFVAGSVFAEQPAGDSPDFIYTCKCGKSCDCNAVTTQKGKCPCGKKLQRNSVLKIEGDKAIVCACGGGCECDYNEGDGSCSCGLPVNEISLEGIK